METTAASLPFFFLSPPFLHIRVPLKLASPNQPLLPKTRHVWYLGTASNHDIKPGCSSVLISGSVLNPGICANLDLNLT